MKAFVIPDVHLKPQMFEDAERLMKETGADRAVCLMDLADDWNRQFDLDLYRDTFDAAIRFARAFPETLWCFGNHDLSYVWKQPESGYSYFAGDLVRKKLLQLRQALPREEQMAVIHRIDGVLFLHGGLTEDFVRTYVTEREESLKDADLVIRAVNKMGEAELWQDTSPIWHRPQYSYMKMYGEGSLLQVAGHTPVERILRRGNVISCDVFSTWRDGSPIGTREYLLIDTVTGVFSGIRAVFPPTPSL